MLFGYVSLSCVAFGFLFSSVIFSFLVAAGALLLLIFELIILIIMIR